MTTKQFISSIRDPHNDQAEIAYQYGDIIEQDKPVIDWPLVNAAICERWKGKSALARIKAMAWRRLES